MILTATPNPALDCSIFADDVQLGSSYRVEPMHCQAGGKGVNVARVLRQFHYDCTAVVLASADGAFSSELMASGIPFQLVETRRPVRTSLAVVDRARADAMVFNEMGADCSTELATRFSEQVVMAAQHASVLTINGSLPPGFPPALIGDLVREAQRLGCRVIVDSAPEVLPIAAAAGADLVKPNAHELAAATGENDPARAAGQLLDAGAQAVLASLGGDGMLLLTAGDRVPLRARLRTPLRGNPTGAGDAAVAALAAGFDTAFPASRADWAELLRTAVAWSAAAVLEPMAGTVHPSYVDLLTQVEITEGE